MFKTIPAIAVHTYVVGTVQKFSAMRAARKNQPARKKNLRDVVGAAQTPSIRDVFAPRFQ